MTKFDNEIGFALCRTTKGKLTHGPVAEGTPKNVGIPIKCPSGSTQVGLFHTHPKGIPFPSDLDVKAAVKHGIKNLCIDADGKLNCFAIRRKTS